MKREWFAARDLAGLIGLPGTVRGITKKARREGWRSRPRSKGKGGGYEYHIEALPPAARIELARRELEATAAAVRTEPETGLEAPVATALPAETDRPDVQYNNVAAEKAEKAAEAAEAESVPAEAPAAAGDESALPAGPAEISGRRHPDIPPEPIFTKAMAKAGLVRAYLDHLCRAPRGRKTEARKEFVAAYNTGQLCPGAFRRLGPVSWQTIERWKRTLAREGDALKLADYRGHRLRGRTVIGREQAAILLGCVLSPNRPRISTAIRQAKLIMARRGIENGYSESTYRRWLAEWRTRNNHFWVLFREGEKAFNDQVAYYIERDYDKIEVGDILVADGHILNFETLNPWTGKPKRMTMVLFYDMKSNLPLGWEIMPTEDTQAISMALRRAILALGKLPKVVYLDNGKAFKSRFFRGCDWDDEMFAGIYAQLGIQTVFAWPYHAQSKTVERFFGSFGELETLMPSYVGRSIDEQPPRLNRGEKWHRKIWEKATGGLCPSLIETHRAIAAWFDEYARRPQRGHLAGRTPLEVFEAGRGPGVDAAELTFLMTAMRISRVTRAGIRFRGRHYYHPELFGLTGAVTIRYDLLDEDYILVFDEQGRFLCEARPKEKVHPAAAQLGDEADREELRRQLGLKRRLEAEAKGPARRLLEEEIMPAVARQLEGLGLSAAGGAERAPSLPAAAAPCEDEAARAARIEAELAELHELNRGVEESDFFAGIDRLAPVTRYEKLLEAEARGLEPPAEEQAWMRYFEQLPTYRAELEHFEELRARLAVEWQQDDGPEGLLMEN